MTDRLRAILESLQEPSWLGLNVDKVKMKFEGDLTFVGEFSVDLGGVWVPCSVFHNAKPNRAKKHKDYLCLFFEYFPDRTLMITGKDLHEMLPATQPGKRCLVCDQVIYSVARHDYRTCKCGKVFVDGGRDYFRASVDGDTVEVDLLNQTWAKQ